MDPRSRERDALGQLARPMQKDELRRTHDMAKKTQGRLSLKKETLRQLGASQLGQVVGGLASSAICLANQDTRTLGSTLPSGGTIGNQTTDEQAGGGGSR
jgi:hypothetical protein